MLPILVSTSGCKTTNTPTPVIDVPVERQPLALKDPAPVQLELPHWQVLTQQNYEQVFKDLRDKDPQSVLLATDPEGYEYLSVNQFKLQQFIQQQKQILNQYRDYYEPKLKPTVK